MSLRSLSRVTEKKFVANNEYAFLCHEYTFQLVSHQYLEDDEKIQENIIYLYTLDSNSKLVSGFPEFPVINKVHQYQFDTELPPIQQKISESLGNVSDNKFPDQEFDSFESGKIFGYALRDKDTKKIVRHTFNLNSCDYFQKPEDYENILNCILESKIENMPKLIEENLFDAIFCSCTGYAFYLCYNVPLIEQLQERRFYLYVIKNNSNYSLEYAVLKKDQLKKRKISPEELQNEYQNIIDLLLDVSLPEKSKKLTFRQFELLSQIMKLDGYPFRRNHFVELMKKTDPEKIIKDRYMTKSHLDDRFHISNDTWIVAHANSKLSRIKPGHSMLVVEGIEVNKLGIPAYFMRCTELVVSPESSSEIKDGKYDHLHKRHRFNRDYMKIWPHCDPSQVKKMFNRIEKLKNGNITYEIKGSNSRLWLEHPKKEIDDCGLVVWIGIVEPTKQMKNDISTFMKQHQLKKIYIRYQSVDKLHNGFYFFGENFYPIFPIDKRKEEDKEIIENCLSELDKILGIDFENISNNDLKKIILKEKLSGEKLDEITAWTGHTFIYHNCTTFVMDLLFSAGIKDPVSYYDYFFFKPKNHTRPDKKIFSSYLICYPDDFDLYPQAWLEKIIKIYGYQLDDRAAIYIYIRTRNKLHCLHIDEGELKKTEEIMANPNENLQDIIKALKPIETQLRQLMRHEVEKMLQSKTYVVEVKSSHCTIL